jgi:hypothetical protein
MTPFLIIVLLVSFTIFFAVLCSFALVLAFLLQGNWLSLQAQHRLADMAVRMRLVPQTQQHLQQAEQLV